MPPFGPWMAGIRGQPILIGWLAYRFVLVPSLIHDGAPRMVPLAQRTEVARLQAQVRTLTDSLDMVHLVPWLIANHAQGIPAQVLLA